MNNKIYNYLLVGLLLVGLGACAPESADISQITNVPFTLSAVDNGITVEEGSQTVTVNFELDANQIVATEVQVTVNATKSTATAGEDFAFETTIVEIPAYVGKGSFTYEILEDAIAEGAETITFTISGVNDPFGASNTLEYAVTITDEKLHLTFDWSGSVEANDTTLSICDIVDLDIYVLDVDGNDLEIYDAATGDCPETIQVTDAWADGTYYLASNLYENGLDSLFLNVPYPITVTASKGGVFTETFVPEDVWTSEDEDVVHDDVTGFKEAIVIEKMGTNYKILKPDGSLIVQGFTSPKQPHADK